ncbi:MAG: hypothetical protein K0S38_354 [Candidatus Paceibacter sp.]|nr:hypothetical protein [Candidatus Paceibacter sp.]
MKPCVPPGLVGGVVVPGLVGGVVVPGGFTGGGGGGVVSVVTEIVARLLFQ